MSSPESRRSEDDVRPSEVPDLPRAAQDRSLLEDVLRSTMASMSSGAPDAALLPEFEAVYRKHNRVPLTFAAVVDLVERVVDRQFRNRRSQEADRRFDVARQIAESFWAEPSVRERLERFWQKLSMRVP